MTEPNPSPKHGTTATSKQQPQTESVSQADGTAADPKGEGRKGAPQEGATQEEAPQEGKTQAQPSGHAGENPATAGKGNTQVQSETPENRKGQINPSAPTEGTEGPSTNVGEHYASQGPSTMDSSGETGNQEGKGTLEVHEQNLSQRDEPGKRPGNDVEQEPRREEDDVESAA